MATETLPALAAKVKLSNGTMFPQIQLGLYMMSGQDCRTAVRSALKLGYRGFDCAQMYYNEREAGATIAEFLENEDDNSGAKRDDVFYTTKLNSNSLSYTTVRRSIKNSVDISGLGYVDLFLLHSPIGGKDSRLASWTALEDAVLDGEVRMAGVSNYGVAHIEELMASNPRVKPVINQVEVHPFNTQKAIRETCAKYGIVVEAYAPLARAMRMEHPKVLELSEKYSCTPAQLLVRWSVQHDMVTLPKSVKAERLRENADIANLAISAEDMQVLDGLDEHLVTDWDPTDAI